MGFIGETCTAHACNIAGALIAVDANTRKVFGKGPEGGFQLRPEASSWPGQVQPKLQKWMKALQDQGFASLWLWEKSALTHGRNSGSLISNSNWSWRSGRFLTSISPSAPVAAAT